MFHLKANTLCVCNCNESKNIVWHVVAEKVSQPFLQCLWLVSTCQPLQIEKFCTCSFFQCWNSGSNRSIRNRHIT